MINLRLIANCRVYTCSKLKKYLKKQKYKKKFDLITILDSIETVLIKTNVKANVLEKYKSIFIEQLFINLIFAKIYFRFLIIRTSQF